MIRPGEMMKQLNQMAFSLHLTGYVRREPGWRKEPHTHRFHSLWFVVKGQGEFVIDGVRSQAEPGKLYAIAPGMVSERTAGSDQPLEYYFIRFSYTSIYEENDEWTYENAESTPFPLRGVYTVHNPPQLINTLEQLVQLWQRRGQVVTMRRKILFLELLVAIAQDFRAQLIAGDTTMAIEMTINHMVHHYRENIALEQLANMAGLSTSHYSRLFKKYAGYSPIEYLTHLRMDRAKEMLALSDYRLKSVAQSVGYTDEFYFSRQFKKTVGCSPSDYAKRHQMKPLK